MGTVLLDEVGEIDASIQVKLLRVLETREFQRIGEATPREFKGKLIAATNRDLATEMRAGSARTWWRLHHCAISFATPPTSSATSCSSSASASSARPARPSSRTRSWRASTATSAPTIPGRATPKALPAPVGAGAGKPTTASRAALEDGGLTARELLGRYCTTVYARTGSYQETARQLALDRHTVKQHIDPELFERLRGRTPPASS